MKALRTGLIAALFALGLGAGTAFSGPLTQPTDQTASIVEGAMDIPAAQTIATDMPAVSETKIDTDGARVSNREMDGSTGRGWPSDADVGVMAKLLMLSTMTGGGSMAGAAFGLQ